jgi:hypothetical protein
VLLMEHQGSRKWWCQLVSQFLQRLIDFSWPRTAEARPSSLIFLCSYSFFPKLQSLHRGGRKTGLKSYLYFFSAFWYWTSHLIIQHLSCLIYKMRIIALN